MTRIKCFLNSDRCIPGLFIGFTNFHGKLRRLRDTWNDTVEYALKILHFNLFKLITIGSNLIFGWWVVFIPVLGNKRGLNMDQRLSEVCSQGLNE